MLSGKLLSSPRKPGNPVTPRSPLAPFTPFSPGPKTKGDSPGTPFRPLKPTKKRGDLDLPCYKTGKDKAEQSPSLQTSIGDRGVPSGATPSWSRHPKPSARLTAGWADVCPSPNPLHKRYVVQRISDCPSTYIRGIE